MEPHLTSWSLHDRLRTVLTPAALVYRARRPQEHHGPLATGSVLSTKGTGLSACSVCDVGYKFCLQTYFLCFEQLLQAPAPGEYSAQVRQACVFGVRRS